MLEKIGIFLCLMLFSTNLWAETLEPSLAGTWYPSSKKELEGMLTKFFNNVELGKIRISFHLVSSLLMQALSIPVLLLPMGTHFSKMETLIRLSSLQPVIVTMRGR